MGAAGRLRHLPGALLDRWHDLRLGIRTGGRSGEHTAEVHRYATISHPSIERVLDGLSLGAGDVLIDLGCGKGRVACCAARRPVTGVIGVEVRDDLCETARRNAETLRGKRAPIEIIQAYAQAIDYDRVDAIYLFDPFGPETLGEVLDRIADSVHRRPRTLRIAYVNPTHERVLAEREWLVEQDRWPAGDRRGIEHAVSFWTTR